MINKNYLIRKIGAPAPKPKMVVADQDAYDIIAQMMRKHKSCACDYDKIADDFDRGNAYDTAAALWNFCKNNIAYDEESINKQFVSSPQTILSKGHCDCKGYALFIGGVLDALNRKGYNYKWRYRFASDDLFNEIPGHVFIVVIDNGKEIWVDPVLPEFNDDHYFPYYQDKKVSAAVGGCGCGCAGHAIGATTAATGQAIIKIAPLLATVPVVGWVASAAAEVIGGIISVVGSKWNQSDDVRWLAQLFEFYALGNKNATSDHLVNEADAPNAQAFFSVVLGVPIGGRKDFNILQSGDGNTNTPNGHDATQRATDYLNFKNLTNQVPLSQAVAAANIAAGLNPSKFPVGGWANLTPAASTIQKGADNSTSDLYVTPSGSLTQGITASNVSGYPATGGGNKLILFAAAAAIAILILK